MNYMPELNAFAERMRRNPLSNNAQLLWYKLMDTANRLHWPETFQLDNGRLKSLLNVGSTHTVLSARQELVDDGTAGVHRGSQRKAKRLQNVVGRGPGGARRAAGGREPGGPDSFLWDVKDDITTYFGYTEALGQELQQIALTLWEEFFPTAAAEPERRPPSVPPHPSTGKARGWQLDNELPTGKKADFGSCLRHSP